MYIISVGFMYIWKLNSYLEGWLKICLKKKRKTTTLSGPVYSEAQFNLFWWQN